MDIHEYFSLKKYHLDVTGYSIVLKLCNSDMSTRTVHTGKGQLSQTLYTVLSQSANLCCTRPLHVRPGGWSCKEQRLVFLIINFEVFVRLFTEYEYFSLVFEYE